MPVHTLGGYDVHLRTRAYVTQMYLVIEARRDERRRNSSLVSIHHHDTPPPTYLTDTLRTPDTIRRPLSSSSLQELTRTGLLVSLPSRLHVSGNHDRRPPSLRTGQSVHPERTCRSSHFPKPDIPLVDSARPSINYPFTLTRVGLYPYVQYLAFLNASHSILIVGIAVLLRAATS